MTAVPASIRYKNPGAMWGGRVATKWGATSAVALNDGLGQGNNIADFPDYISGAAAQFYLWSTGYVNMTLQAAITKWSGGNSSTSYMQFLESKTGLSASSQITSAILSGSVGLALMKAQAQWEAGEVYPMSDADWAAAQKKVFASTTSASTSTPKGTSMTATTTTPTTPTAAPATPSILDTLAGIASTAEKVVEAAAKIEPTVAMFVPGSSVWQPFVVLAIPFIERALTDIATKNGGDIFGAVIELLQHVTPAQPNSPVLSVPTTPTS